MVLHHLQKLLEFGKTCCQFAWASVGSTFALLASFWHSTCGPSTKHLGFKTWCVLPICESWILERCGIGQHAMELTSWFVCRFLPHVNSSYVHIFTFCACALERARLWRTGLTWPDQGCVLRETFSILWQNCDSCCMFRFWPQKNLQNRSGNDGCSFSSVASICRRLPQPNKLAEPMARNFTWLECSGSKICSGSWRFDVVAAKPTTIFAFMFLHCWFTWCSMGIKNCGLETPEY